MKSRPHFISFSSLTPFFPHFFFSPFSSTHHSHHTFAPFFTFSTLSFPITTFLIPVSMALITDLPTEILQLIGDLLDKRGLLNALRTCQLFHQHFSFWKEVKIQAATTSTTIAADAGNSLLNADTLLFHVRKVHSYNLSGPLPAEYFAISFPHLTVLKLQDISTNNVPAERDREQESNWARVIRLNPTIRDVDVFLRHKSGGQSTEIWDAISETLQRPRQLKVGGPSDMPFFSVEVQKSFWRAVGRFKELDYNSSVDQLCINPHNCTDLSGLEGLSYKGATSIVHSLSHIRLFKKFRGLRRLRWSRTGGGFPYKEFLRCLVRSAWPLLDDLTLDDVYQTDANFALVMHRLPPLKRLGLGGASFGPLCFGHLKERQFATLRILDLTMCKNFTSPMALEVLQECLHLEDFMGRQISVRDLLGTSHRPWICHRLKRLGVHFDNDLPPGDALDANRVVLEYLSSLTSLEEIDTVLDGAQGMVCSNERTCRWRLDAGLEQLGTLTRLRIVRYDYSVTHMRVEDVQWMVDHWPSLEVLQGYISLDADIKEEANALLNKRGIRRY